MVFRIANTAEQFTLLQRRVARTQEVDVIFAPHKAHVRHAVNERFWFVQDVLNKPKSFINSVPHMSFVWGEDNVNFLRARYAALQQSELFRGIRYSEDHHFCSGSRPSITSGAQALIC